MPTANFKILAINSWFEDEIPFFGGFLAKFEARAFERHSLELQC